MILSFFRKSFSRPYDDAYYTGEFSAGGEREGQGILEFENGQRYHIYAKSACAATLVYARAQAAFSLDISLAHPPSSRERIAGACACVCACAGNGRYVGEWQKDKFHGHGTYTLNDGAS